MSSEEDQTTNPHKTVVTVISSAPNKRETSEACLVVIYGDDLGRRVPLGRQPTVLGRSSKCDVQIDQESVSRNHCRITFNGKTYTMRDLGSTNGTYVNDELIDEINLRDGDQIKVGRTILKFITGNNIETQYHEEIYRLMTIDGLTDVHNKRYFHEMLEREVSRSQRYERVFAVVLFDIDHFKKINDSFGHLAGDSVLRQLGVLVKSRVRRDDIVARVGGEEFAVLLPEVGLEGGLQTAEKIRDAVQHARFTFEGTPIEVTLSAGVAAWEAGVKDGQDLVKRADDKLYEAKNTGRNRALG
jgi:two-component system, cell cycle response regulator